MTSPGWALGNGPLTASGRGAAFAAAIAAPPVGLAVLAMLAPLKSPALVPAPGFNTILVVALLLGCVYRLPIDRPRFRLSLPLLLMLGFLAFVTVQQLPDLASGYAGDEGHRTGYLFIQFATLAGMALAAGYVLRDRWPGPFLVAGILGAVIASLLGIATYVLPPGSVANLVDLSDPLARIVGPFGDPNYFALFCATAVAACAGLIVVVRSGRLRLLLAVAAITISISLVVALSRGSIVALGAGLVTLAFTRGRWTGILTIGLFAVLAFGVYPLLLASRLEADAGAVTAQAYATLANSDESRVAAALAGVQIFLTSPVFGIGFGQYAEVSGRYTGYAIESHNWYANVLAEQGLVGIVLWMSMLVAVVIRLARTGRAARSVGFAVLTTYAAGSFFLQPPLSVQTSAFTVIVVVAALVGDWRPLWPDRPEDAASGRQLSSGSPRPRARYSRSQVSATAEISKVAWMCARPAAPIAWRAWCPGPSPCPSPAPRLPDRRPG